MRKITLTIAAAALALGVSGAAFAAPGKHVTPPGNSQAPVLVACPTGQGGVLVTGLVQTAAADPNDEITNKSLIDLLFFQDGVNGVGPAVQASHADCDHGSLPYTP